MSQSPIRAADFISNIGIEAQINYTDSAYANIGNVVSDLKYLGINLVRAATVNSAGSLQGQQHLATAADAGIRFDFVMNGNKAVTDQVAQLAAFQAKHPGSVYAVEGPNEIDHTPITYNGLTGGAAAVSFQNDLYSSVRAQSILNGTQVYSFSLGSGATPTGGYNETALHPYARNGSQPYATLANELKLSPASATNVFSETGYSTLPSWQSGVDQTTQAKYLLNTVFDSMKLGVQTTYLYSLLDAYADPSNTNSENHYGLFNLDNSPKTAATAIHNLTTILSDTGSSATTFTTSALNYSVANMPTTGSSEMLEKSSGAYDIVLWNEPTIWNATSHSEVQATTVHETVNLGATYGTVKIYDPMTGTTAIQQLSNVSSLTVGILDHPVIIEVSNPVVSTPVTPPASDPVVSTPVTPPVSDPVVSTPVTPPVQSASPTPPATVSSPPVVTTPSVINGTVGNNTLNGTSGADTIHGLGGNDVIHAGAGDDLIDIGAGKSAVDGGDGFDTLSFANATSGIRIRLGTLGYQAVNDKITVNPTNIEAVVGSAFNDTFVGSSHDDHMSGGAGNDSFTSGGGHDVIDGGTGIDTLSFDGVTHGVTLSLASQAVQALDSTWSIQVSNVETVTGSAYADVLTANDTGSTLNGGGGNDMLIGGAGNDHFVGGGGEDTVSYANAKAAVTVSLLATSAQQTGGAGIDTLSAIEDLIGSSFNDTLFGDKNANKIDGGAGNDVIKGAGGADTLTGGAGADHFVYAALSDSTLSAYDTITDFSHADGDKIDLSALDANSKVKGVNSFSLVDHFTGVAGQLEVVSQNGGYFVEGDVDGDGHADLAIFVHSNTKLIASDFVL